MFAVPPYRGPERRCFIRIPYESEARGVASDAREGLVRVLDVSRIGLRVDSPCALRVGAPLAVVFEDVYFEDAPVNLQGRVVWVQPAGDRHRAGIGLAHPDGQSIAAASELFYAAIDDVSRRIGGNYARIARK